MIPAYFPEFKDPSFEIFGLGEFFGEFVWIEDVFVFVLDKLPKLEIEQFQEAASLIGKDAIEVDILGIGGF